MDLEAPKYSKKILGGLNFLRKDKVLCDYLLCADSDEIWVHRVVMAACSDYFKVMFSTEMRESRSERVKLQGVTGTGLRKMVEFAYTGSLRITLDNLEEVLAAASHLQITEALDLCVSFMEKAITIDNCVDILNMSELYSLAACGTIARNFILENFEALADSPQYSKLTSGQLCQLLAENSLRVVSEYKLFELVLRWINVDRTDRDCHTAELMNFVRLPLLSGEELVEKVSVVELMQMNPECNRLLTAAKDYHIVVSKQPLLQSSRTQVRSGKRSIVLCHGENIESYDLTRGKHSFLKDAPVPLYNPCVCVVDNFMYACGGKYDSHDNNEIATARCFRYDPRFDVWYELSSMNEARKDFAMVSMNNRLYAIAGQDENMVMCTVECFSIAKNDWDSIRSLSQAAYGHSGVRCDNRIYISGGQKVEGQCNAVLSYDAEADTWLEQPPLLHARVNHSMVEHDGILYVAGGNTEDPYGFPVPVTRIEMLRPGDTTWTQCEATLNIREAGSCVYKDQIFIVGGINGQHYYSDLIYAFEPKKDKVHAYERFPSRIFGRSCCILTLPQYV